MMSEPLPEIHSGSLVGWKTSHGYVNSTDGTLWFRPLADPRVLFSVEDKAYCREHKHWHFPVPYMYCGCGFNAWSDVETAQKYYYKLLVWHEERKLQLAGTPACDPPPSWVMLRVDLHGRVIEGTLSVAEVNDYGYRAEHQVVRDMFIPPGCGACGEDAKHLASTAIETYDVPERGGTDFHRVRPLCSAHLVNAYEVFDLDELSERNDVGVHWGYPDPAPE